MDCPTCGRSVRVPEQDGHSEPVPEPQFDMKDSLLADALNEVAMIGQEPQEKQEELSDQSNQASGNIKEVSVAPMPEPIELDPPLPAEPVVIAPASSEALSPSGPSAAVQTEPPVARSAEQHVSLESVISQIGHPGPAPQEEIRLKKRPPRRTQRDAMWTFVMFVGVILLAAGAAGFGYLAGSRNSADNSSAPAENSHPGNAGNVQGSLESSQSTRKPALTGQITYKTEEGISRADAKARVIVFPQSREGQVKLSVVGFRAADEETDFRVVAAAFRELGGDAAVVDEKGDFVISLPKAGAYQILVLSNHLSREKDKEIPTALRELLEQYFDRPDSLLGRVLFYFGPVRYQGEKAETWYYSFDRN
ncbi:MAG: hypothetical protein IID46_00925 [Planctomycetes bacterium]|nr:hypothetical protein [Planctomycetota bacterium]